MAKPRNQGNKSRNSKPSPNRQEKKQDNKSSNPRPIPSRQDEEQDDRSIMSKAGISRKEWWIIIGAVIAGCFTLIGAIITILGPPFFEIVIPRQTSVAISTIQPPESLSFTQTTEPRETRVIQSPLPQPTLSLPQFAPSLTSSCEQSPPEPVAVVDQLSDSRFAPLRFDFVVVHPAHNLLPEGFGLTSHTFQDEAAIKQLPAVDILEFFIDVVGLNEKEWIRAENFLLVRFDSIELLQLESVDVASSIYGGGGRAFHTTACWQGKAEPGIPLATSRITSADLFTFSPGELIPIWLTLDLSGLEPAIYSFHIGVVYTYEGNTLTAWSDRGFSLVVPHKQGRTDWIYYSSGQGISFIPDS